MVKKAVVIFLLLIYGSTSVGATVYSHYCMNKFVSLSFSQNNEDDKCGNCGMKGNIEGCCKDKYKQIKLKEEHQKTTFSQNFHLYYLFVNENSFKCFDIHEKFESLIPPISINSPRVLRERLYILNSVFLV